MKTYDSFIAHPTTDEQVVALKAFMKALKIDFELSKAEENPYDADFVNKIKKSRKDYKNKKGKTITLQELNQLWK